MDTKTPETAPEVEQPLRTVPITGAAISEECREIEITRLALWLCDAWQRYGTPARDKTALEAIVRAKHDAREMFERYVECRIPPEK